MSRISLFFIPVIYESKHKTLKQRATEAFDDYFSFGQKKIRVLGNQKLEWFQEKPTIRELAIRALKIASLFTIIIPALFLIAKALLRTPIAVTTPCKKEEKPTPLKMRIANMSEEELDQICSGDLTYRDIRRLFSPNWLNGDCISAYLSFLLKDKDHITFVDSYAIPNLYKVRSLYKVFHTNRLFGVKDMVFFPLHVNKNHWALLVADLNKKVLRYYDSLSTTPNVAAIRAHLQKVAEAEGLTPPPFELVIEKCPKQKNGFDCGVFLLMAARCISRGEPLNYSQDDALSMRRQILIDLLSTT